MKKVLFFDSMLTPKIITAVYWLLLLVVIVSGIGAIVEGQMFLVGIGIIIGGAVGVRIWCELLIVLFKIHENLKTLAAAKS